MIIEKQSKAIKGGARPGAGRKKGEPNKRTAEIQKAVEASGLTPLDYMLMVMRDEAEDSPRRLAAATAAAPYVHAKLSSIELSGDMRITRPQELTDDELANIAASSGG
jgi:hypothetical protein